MVPSDSNKLYFKREHRCFTCLVFSIDECIARVPSNLGEKRRTVDGFDATQGGFRRCLQSTRESGEHVVIVFRCKAALERVFVSSTGLVL